MAAALELQHPLVKKRVILRLLVVHLHKGNRLPLANLHIAPHHLVAGMQAQHLPLANQLVTLLLSVGLWAAHPLEDPLLVEGTRRIHLVVINSKVAGVAVVAMMVVETQAGEVRSHRVGSSRRASASTAMTVGFHTACKTSKDREWYSLYPSVDSTTKLL